MDILKKIEHYRSQEEKLKWEGTFADYLKLLEVKPWVAQSAHSRIYNMIKDAGVEEENGRKIYRFFSNRIVWAGRSAWKNWWRSIFIHPQKDLMSGKEFCS